MSTLLMTATEKLLVDRLFAGGLPAVNPFAAERLFLRIAAALAGIGVVLLIYAFYSWAITVYAQYTVLAMIGGLVIASAILCCLIAFTVIRLRRRQLHRVSQDVMETITDTLGLIDEELAKPVRDNPKMALILASIAGFIVGEKAL